MINRRRNVIYIFYYLLFFDKVVIVVIFRCCFVRESNGNWLFVGIYCICYSICNIKVKRVCIVGNGDVWWMGEIRGWEIMYLDDLNGGSEVVIGICNKLVMVDI